MVDEITSESAAPHLAKAVTTIDKFLEDHIWSDDLFKAWRLVRATLHMRGERLNERQDF